MLEVNQELKNIFSGKSPHDVEAMELELHILNVEEQTDVIFNNEIMELKESLVIDKMPIGTFPIGILEFQLRGQISSEIDINGNYEVEVEYKYDSTHADGTQTKDSYHSKKYIINEIEYTKESNTTFIKGYDYGSKLSEPYDEEKYELPLTFSEFTEAFYRNHGLEIKNIDDLFMGDYELKALPSFELETMSLDVARAISKMSMGFQYIDSDNKVNIINTRKLMDKYNSSEIEEIDVFKSFVNKPDNFKELGINRLVLGLTAEIEDENVSIQDESMVEHDGIVELRIDNNPFVYNESLKHDVIEDMFNHVKGFKYRAFESENRLFYYEIGDVFLQKGQDSQEDDYPVIVLGNETTYKGSVLTKLSAESKSVEETKNAWSSYTLYKKTEILIDKNNQAIKIAVEKVDDVEERTAIMEVELDKLSTTVEFIHNGNIIPNFNGADGYTGWGFIPEQVFTDEMEFDDVTTFSENRGIVYTEDYLYRVEMQYGFNFYPKPMRGSESEYGISMFGTSFSPVGAVLTDAPYSFRARLMNFVPFEVTVIEIDSEEVEKETKRYSFRDNKEYVDFTHTFEENTRFVRLKFTSDEMSVINRLELTEMMFNRGIPKAWFSGADDAMAYARTIRTQLAGEIKDVAEEVNIVDGKINNTTVTITGRDGVVIRNNNGKGLTVINDDGQKVIELNSQGQVIARDMIVENAEITGDLRAGTIAGLKFANNRISFPNGDLALDSSENAIMFGTTKMRFSQTYHDTGEGQYYSDNVSIKTTAGEILIGDFTNPVSPEPMTAMSGVDAILTRMIYNPDGLIIGSVQGNDVYFNNQWLLNGDFTPLNNGVFNIGRTSNRVKQIYLSNQPNVSSDMRIKANILPIDEEFIRIFGKEVEPKTYYSKTDGRTHFGYIAQDVERALYKYVTTQSKQNRMSKDYKIVKSIVDNFSILEKEESFMSLLYGEIAVITDAYNRLINKDLSDRLDKIEKMIEGGL